MTFTNLDLICHHEQKERNIEVIAIPGYRGNEKDVDDLVHFVLGDDAPSNVSIYEWLLFSQYK